MFTVNNNNVLPEIFLSAHNFFEEVSTELSKLSNVSNKVPAYIAYGWLYAKASLGDLCVGVKALGDKLGVLGGNSFTTLKEQSDALVAATGNFFNSINPENFYEQAKNYVTLLSGTMKEISNSTTHLYGDAKNRLNDQFESMENAMVSFFRMAKVKIVAALADAQVAAAFALEYFAGLNIANTNLANQDGTLNKQASQQLVLSLIQNFDDAKNLALKMFN